MASNGKYRNNDSAKRGQTIRTETGRDRSDDAKDFEGAVGNELKGDATSIDHSIKGGKVPTDA